MIAWDISGNLRESNRRVKRRARKRLRTRLELQILEDRTLPALLTVTSTGDSGAGTLRAAILTANSTTGASTISFDISGSGVQVINLASPLPSILHQLTISGTTQPGYAGSPLILLNGSALSGTTANGLHILTNDCVIDGLDIGKFANDGILIADANDNWIQGDYIGTDPTGKIAAPDGKAGVLISAGAGNTIGTNGAGTGDAAERDIISGNTGDGVDISGTAATGNVVAGDYIGTDVTGLVAIGNNNGVGILGGASSNRIGVNGADPNPSAERNVISGNITSTTGSGGIGVDILSSGTISNWISGNLIGTDATGTHALGNAGSGVAILSGAQSNLIGASAGVGQGLEANVISGNEGNGVLISDSGTNANQVIGNFIGTDTSASLDLGNAFYGVDIVSGAQSNQIGSTASPANVIDFNTFAGVSLQGNTTTGDRIEGNSIYQNDYLGIDLGGDGVTLNHLGGAVTGPNNLQNFPVLQTGTPGSTTTVSGTLDSGALTRYTLDFYVSAGPDPTLYGEGQIYLGSTSVTTNASGNSSFSATLPGASSAGQWLTATATDPSGDTSEFGIALQLPANPVPLNAETWQPLGPAPLTYGNVPGSGPTSGRVAAVAADPTNPDVIYVAAGEGGVWKTTNGGTSWTSLTDNQPTLSMGAIAVAPSNPSIIYAGTGEAANHFDAYYGLGVLKSSDGGNTWTLLTGNTGTNEFNRRTISRIVIDPTDPNTVYVAVAGSGQNGLPGNTGVWKSTDGGTTWTDTTASITTTAAYSDLIMDPTNPQVLFTAVGTYTGDMANGVYVTTNGGTSWSPAGNFPMGTGDGLIKLAIADTNHLELFASIVRSTAPYQLSAMMESTNGGSTWSPVTSAPNYMGGSGYFDSTLAIDPTNANVIFAAGEDGADSVIESTNGGVSWNDISTGADGRNGPHADHHAIGFTANGQLLDGNDGGIWLLSDATPGSIVWTDINGNLETLLDNGGTLSSNNLNLFYSGAQDNGNDEYQGGPAWTQQESGDIGKVWVDPSNPLTLYHTASAQSVVDGEGPKGIFEISTDGGIDWTPEVSTMMTSDPTNGLVVATLDPSNPDHLLLGTNHVYETTNQGTAWTPISSPNTNGWNESNTNAVVSALAIAPSSTQTIYASAGGNIYVTFNDGGAWTKIDTSYTDSFGALLVSPSSNMTVYAVRNAFTGGSGGHVFESTNGGGKWTDISGNLPDLPANTIALDSRDGILYVGTDAGVYASNNGGASWTLLGAGLPNARVVDLELNPSENLLAAALYGRGEWEIDTTHLGIAAPQNVTAGVPFTITVSALDNFGNPIPGYTGTVHFTSSDGTAVLPKDYQFTTSDSGVHTFLALVLDTPGIQTITVDDTANPSVSATFTIDVTHTTTTSVSTSSSVTVFGQAVTFTATVSSLALGTPTGTVSFLNGSATIGTGTLAGGTATFTTSVLGAGTHSITAAYGGDTNFSGSTSAILSQTVNPDGTTTTVIPSADPSVFGQTVTFTATVAANAPGSGTPTGTVTFFDGTATLGKRTLSAGSATFTTSTFTVRTHTITARYAGDANFTGSTSPAVSQTVKRAASTTRVSSSVTSAVFGQSVTFTATVSATAPGSGPPTGTVTFKNGGSTLGTASLSAGTATFTTSALAVGTRAITVIYGGDTNFIASTSPALSVTIKKDNSTTSVTASATSIVFGQTVTFTATVSAAAPGSGTPTGTVTFKNGGSTLGTATLNAGTATLTTSALAVGTRSITVVYGGDANFNTSTSAALKVTVGKDGTTSTLVSSANPSVSGQSVTFTATVLAKTPGSGTPTGTVTFKDGASTLGTATLTTGTASFTTSTLAVGTHSITAIYGGDANFIASTSPVLIQTVNAALRVSPVLLTAAPPAFALETINVISVMTVSNGQAWSFVTKGLAALDVFFRSQAPLGATTAASRAPGLSPLRASLGIRDEIALAVDDVFAAPNWMAPK